MADLDYYFALQEYFSWGNIVSKNIGIIGYQNHAFGIGSATKDMSICLEEQSFGVEKFVYEEFKEIVRLKDLKNHKLPSGELDLLISAVTTIHATKLPQSSFNEIAPPYIAYWWWELEELPEYFLKNAEFFDEIWAPTTFIYNNLKKALGAKVALAPLILRFNWETEGFTRTDFQLPEDVPIFLVRFDFNSTIDRKNPYAAIDAFKNAFGSQTEAYLLIKTVNGENNLHLLEELISIVEDRSDIRVWDKKLTRAINNDLMKCVTGYLSLHRAEGLGLNILEAMQAKVPVVTTGYGGNMDFCTNENSFLISFKLVPVEDRSYLYPPLGVWAEPEIEDAAKAIRSIVNGGEEIKQKIDAGWEKVNTINKSKDFAGFVEKKIEEHKNKKRYSQNNESMHKKSNSYAKSLIVKSRNYLKLK
jgi:glycosyltransferase involved in cell wall biosynthesis